MEAITHFTSKRLVKFVRIQVEIRRLIPNVFRRIRQGVSRIVSPARKENRQMMEGRREKIKTQSSLLLPSCENGSRDKAGSSLWPMPVGRWNPGRTPKNPKTPKCSIVNDPPRSQGAL